MTALERKRMEKRLTRAALAEAAAVHYDTIASIEGGARGTDATLFKLADALNCQPWELREQEAAA
jgi:transcriptional regulator with XRE-family HTH domain